MSDWYDELLTAFEENDRSAVLCVLQRLSHIPESSDKLQEECEAIVLTACQKGFTEVLEFFYNSGIDYTETGTEWSPLQVACEYGHEDVVEWYIQRGVPILPGRVKPWEEESPLYIASKNGCHAIVQKLIGGDPSLIKDDKVRQCLLYAACLSGDIQTVKNWLSPCMDINHPLQLVKNLTDCEKLTPLYAACSGGHVNVISFLRENYDNLTFTASACNAYPEVVGEVMKKFIEPVKSTSQDEELFKECIGYFQCKNLQVLHNSWLANHQVTLVELNVSNNFLTELPSCLPWKLQNLKVLNASKNCIKHLEFMDDGSCTSLSLEEVNLSFNNLEKVCRELFEVKTLTNLNLSHNKLMYLSKSLMHQTDPEIDSINMQKRRSVIQERHWCCSKLRRLDVSFNSLVMLPVEVQACTELVNINASNNRLTTFPQPWGCPLENLNLRNNQLERFPVSIELFWSGSLKYLDISDNLLHEINEGIVKLSILCDLIACNNKIERLPGPDTWELGHLHNLNLKHNKLGIIADTPTKNFRPNILTRRTRSTSNEDTRHLKFPASLAHCLKELRLGDNNLDCVPPSICVLTGLEILDLSDNPLIKVLPREMGYLRNLGMLKLKGVEPSNISPGLMPESGCKTKEIISELLENLRESKPYNKIKAVVLGKKDKGKTTLVNIIAGKKAQKLETKSIVRKEISLTKKTFAVWRDTEIKLNVWDIAGDDAYTQIHHSVFTPHTLYILVWDFWSITEELEKIARWINNIQAKSANYKVVLVGTFIDKLGSLKAETVHTVNAKLVEKFGHDQTPTLCPVSCINNDGIDDLKVTLYDTALSMKLSVRGRPPLIGRKIPRSYKLIEKRIAEEQQKLEDDNKPLYLTQSEFINVIESVQANDLLSDQETTAVTKFLEEIGAILHFSDQLGALDTLYFLDPAWLCDILVYILICPEGKKLLKQERGKIKRSAAEKLYENANQFPTEFVKQYIELLERFEIATCISQSDKLFFPCQLPMEPPIIETADFGPSAVIVRRLYKMSECPTGFWMRLITRMMIRVEQFEKTNWHFKPSIAKSMRLMTLRRSNQRSGSFNKQASYHGLQINKPKQTYSREMIHVSHEEGSFCVEPISFSAGDLQKGVLITEESRTANFAMMGVIVDEIEDIIQDFYPGLMELDSLTMRYHMERYALCSTCYQGLPLSNDISHFTMEHCARMLVNEECITCPLGVKLELSMLVPDLLMKEIPEKFFMDVKKLSLDESKEKCLGSGVTGSVFKATYDGVPVAIKMYRSDIRNARKMNSVDSHNSDSGTATLSTQGSMADDEQIYQNLSDAKKISCIDEAESIKALRAIREMRQEVSITSRLQHPCIISLIGIAFRPKLMMALELAPLGSLRDILDKELQGRPAFNKYKNKDELFPPLFEKELIFKFVYQIAKGLEYLHSNGIIYKDLKSDNILTVSKDLSATVNLKLSDYGISKFCWAGRSVGLVGTPGYQAPEILDGKPYDEKVDIFSLSMVIYEIWTGKRPYSECENLAQITKAMKIEGRRPNIKDIRILTKFPYMENMMASCWENTSSLRPAAKIMASRHCMQNVQFLAETWAYDQPFSSRCVLGPSESSSKPVLCLWDKVDTVCSFTILDPEWLTIPVKRVQYDCPPVTCMATAGKHIWVGHSTGATVYSPNSGSLDKIGGYQLDGEPVQILSILNRKAEGHVNSYKVFVALSQGTLLQFQTQKSANNEEDFLRRKSVKRIHGYSMPSSIVLRTEKVYCMAHAQTTDELWIGCEGYIDIVSCRDFKVNSDQRININILMRLCKLHPHLNIVQMVNYGCQMFCLLGDSPFILEFNINTYKCISLLNLDAKNVYTKVVVKEMDLSEADHEAYLGVTTADFMGNQQCSDDSDSEQDSADDPPKLPPRKDRPPQVPIRNRSPSKKAQRVLGIGSGDYSKSVFESLPPVPPKPVRPVTSIAPPRPPKIRTIGPEVQRSPPSLDRNISFSLPNLPRTKEFSVIMTSMIIVKDTLWVGRSCGSISVVSVSRDSRNFGMVIADLYDSKRNKHGHKTVDGVKLVNTGKYVAAGYSLSSDSESEVAIAFWEGYGAADIGRIDKFYSDIITIENSLSRASQLENQSLQF